MPEDTGNDPSTPSVTPPSTPPSDPPVATPESTPTTSVPADTTTPAPADAPTLPLAPKPMSEEQVASLKKGITEDVSGEVSKSVIQKIGEALGLTKKEEVDNLPTDAEALKKIVDTEVTRRFEKETQDTVKQQKQEATNHQNRIDGTVRNWHTQYSELSRLGKVPVIKNEADEQDEGVEARKKIILAMGGIISEMQKVNPNSDYLPSISEVLVRFPNVLKGPPGADLPISGNTAVRENADSFSYEKDIAGMTFDQIIDQGK